MSDIIILESLDTDLGEIRPGDWVDCVFCGQRGWCIVRWVGIRAMTEFADSLIGLRLMTETPSAIAPRNLYAIDRRNVA